MWQWVLRRAGLGRSRRFFRKQVRIVIATKNSAGWFRLIPNHTDVQWVLRLDDDEFPSRALIDWILDRLDDLDTNIVGILRRWVRMGKNGHC